MSLKTKTMSELVHRTTLSGYEGLKDGGRQRLLEAHDLVHSEKQVGRMIIDYGPGGSINSLVFEERAQVPQRWLADMGIGIDGGGNGHATAAATDALATRGVVTTIKSS